MENNSELTAITRNKLSSPTRYLFENGLLVGRILDYGCGKGFDVRYLCENGYDISGYDKYYYIKRPSGTFDTIICNYVLNVLELEFESEIIKDIKNLLSENGKAFITVRRDIKKEGYRKNGNGITFQRNVLLNAEILKENCSYCIYKINK